jgi:putative hydrolase of the HAD superfamily
MLARPQQSAQRVGMADDRTPPADLSDIDFWVFDLDNTLYSPAAGLFRQVDERMGSYIMGIEDVDAATARQIQKRYFHDHGTTLAGLMAHHGVQPAHFLDYVHDVDLSVLRPSDRLRDAIAALPGTRHIFTNADANYAERVLDAVGLSGLFSGITDIHATTYVPKPQQSAYDRLSVDIARFDPRRALFVDDMTRNLAPAHAMGIRTLWFDNGSESGDRQHDPAHVDHHITGDDVDVLADWLKGVKQR